MKPILLITTLSLLIFTGYAHSANVAQLQSEWANITYEVNQEAREHALHELAEQARASTADNPNNVDLLIWQGIIVSSLAGEKGGLGALGLAKEAKASFESALSRNPIALQGSAHTSLGTLYHKVPGWPIAFGSDKKAERHLKKALAVNPNGIDSNYFMAAFLFDESRYQEARKYLITAGRAQDRPDRPIADRGRRSEIAELMAQVEQALE